MRYKDILTELNDPKMDIDPRQLTKAAAEGFVIDRIWYHGTKNKFSKFREPKGGGIDELGKGIYVTSSISAANAFANVRGGGDILACVLKNDRLFELSTLPQGMSWSGEGLWGELLDAYNRHLDKHFSIPSMGVKEQIDREEFHKRVKSNANTIPTALREMGYIGATSRYSQIKGQAVVWNPHDIKIVGKMPSIPDYISDSDYGISED